MNKRVSLIALLPLLMLAAACFREDLPTRYRVPEGTPVTLTIGFGAQTPVDVHVGTKAEASRADESRVHDLYVLIFDDSGTRKYGRYFNYQHKWDSTSPLTSTDNENEGWYVQNKTLDGITPAVDQTVGAVKIATKALSSCTLVLLANVENTLLSLGGQDPLTALNEVVSYSDLKDLEVRLEQDIVVRNDLFLMLGEKKSLDMTDMTWNANPAADGFGTDYRVTLSPLDAKVKFRIKGNPDKVTDLVPHRWLVANVPSSCYLYERTSYAFPSDPQDPGKHYYFNTEPAYFEAEETDGNGTWQTFTFYMLESCLSSTSIPNPSDAASYYLREKQDKTADPVQSTDGTINYVSNGDWTYAPANAPFVTFSVSLALTSGGIDGLATWDAQNTRPAGVTGEMSYTVHLGEFTQNGANDYNTKRGHFYTYDITLNNATNLYAEVKSFNPNDPDDSGLEGQPGQEGALLVNTGGVVNCDAHYEYRSLEFAYNSVLAAQLAADPDYHVFSWFVKTPFTDDGKPVWDSNNHRYISDSTKVDFLWVKFAINKLESGTDPKQSTYSLNRIPYPGKDEYDYAWYPGKAGNVPALMDINQLINYIYYQYRLKSAGGGTDIFDTENKIRATAFVDEFYYEFDPFSGQVDPDLWRKFVNADPREMHILSDVQSSRDRKSNIINSSHSIIQRSIQTIYNVDSPELRSIWGVEHKDEIRETEDESLNDWAGWPWGVASDATINAYVKSTDNGRINSAALWGLYPSPDANHDEWEDFLEYAVINSIPELKDAEHRIMAYSCLTRNRDNDGDGIIDPEEVRWYMASINQLKGMWIGNESLSTTARVYQPWKGDWRAHVLSSTCPGNAATPKVLNAEEGVATFDYALSHAWAGGNAAQERLRESVRCVRNVGTYTIGNTAYDITNAPYSQIPDNFYTYEKNVDPEHPTDDNYATYTFLFRRLDPRSLREFTDKDLPFHDEKSANNHVYLELHVQSRASRATETPDYSDASFPTSAGTRVDMGTINEQITNDGYNKYCPTGYRLPNQTELAVMTLVLPSSYWNNSLRLPTRTYFSHGMYAPVSQRKSGEEYKLGFAYNSNNSGNIFLPDRNANNGEANTANNYTNRVRCVRDSDMTGAITGKMYLADTLILPGETTTLTFNFSSTAASFKTGTLYLCYNDANGNPVEMQIPLATQPAGQYYRTSQSFTAPDPNTLSPAPGALPFPMRLKLVLTNARDNSEEIFYTPFTLANVDIFCDFEILPGSDAVKGFPIRVHAETISEGSSISSVELQWRKLGDSDWTTLDTFAAATGKTVFNTTAYFNPATLETTAYFFRIVAASGSNTITSARKAMEFVKVGYTMNDGLTLTGHSWTDSWWNTIEDGQTVPNAYLWHNSLVGNVPQAYVNQEQASVINETWQGQRVTNLDFAAGDFIEADLDLTNCTFIRTVSGDITKQPYKNQVIGLDNIFSIGKTTINWGNNATNELHFYYPAHVGDNDDQLQVDPVYNGGYINPKLGPLNNGKVVLMLNRDGAWRDGAVISVNDAKYTSVIGNLTTASSLIIGAQEGVHHSRATYNYVRVVHNDLTKASGDVTGGFNQDPQNGGNL